MRGLKHRDGADQQYDVVVELDGEVYEGEEISNARMAWLMAGLAAKVLLILHQFHFAKSLYCRINSCLTAAP